MPFRLRIGSRIGGGRERSWRSECIAIYEHCQLFLNFNDVPAKLATAPGQHIFPMVGSTQQRDYKLPVCMAEHFSLLNYLTERYGHEKECVCGYSIVLIAAILSRGA